MGSMSSSLIADRGCVKTGSWLRMRYLTRFKGYTVDRVVEQPSEYAFGRLRYCKKWVLRPPQR